MRRLLAYVAAASCCACGATRPFQDAVPARAGAFDCALATVRDMGYRPVDIERDERRFRAELRHTGAGRNTGELLFIVITNDSLQVTAWFAEFYMVFTAVGLDERERLEKPPELTVEDARRVLDDCRAL